MDDSAASKPEDISEPPRRLVFISHSSRDAVTAMQIASALEAAGVACWIAPRDIRAGMDYADEIMTGINACNALLLVYSRHSVDSDPVKREVERTRNRKVPIIPVRLENVPPSPSMEFLIAMSQWVDAFPPPVDRHLETIVSDVKRSLALEYFRPRPDPNATPKYVGPYRILEKIGEGGMGTVYKAEQRSPVKRIVALKLIKLGLSTQEVLARFEAERQALARMNHPNVARVLDADADELGRPYFIMEYVPGKPITQFADEQKLSIKQRLELFTQVCDAIAHAHTKSLLHRDIKAANVLASMEDGKPVAKVIDFGIAKALTGEKLTDRTFNTAQGLAIGSYESMSPEQADGSPDIDTRTDVYSLGVLLYELLTGAKPFDSQRLLKSADAEIKRIIREVDPPKPSTRLSGLTAAQGSTIANARRAQVDALTRELRSELEWIPLMAMRKERDRRYASPIALADDIRDYLAGKPLLAAPDSTAYRVRKFIHRNCGAIIAATVVLTVLLLGIAGTSVGMVIAHRATIRALEEKKNTEDALVEAGRQRDQAKRQEEEAKKQREIADAVSAFQTDMLETANPDNLLGDKVTVLQAINAAVKKLDAHETKLSPLSEATVRESIGATFEGLGRYPEAESNFRIALDIRRKLLSATDPAIADSLDALGWLLDAHLRRPAEAEQLERAALRIRQSISVPGDTGVATSMMYLGSALESQNKLDEAEWYLGEAMRINQKTLPAGSKELGDGSNNFAIVLEDEHKLSEAEQLYRQALAVHRNTLPAGHPDIAINLENLGRVLDEEGKFADAEPLYLEALEIDRKTLPLGHPDLTNVLYDLAKASYRDPKHIEDIAICRDGFRQLQEYDLKRLRNHGGKATPAAATQTTSPSRTADANPVLPRQIVNSIGMKLNEILPGSFMMGSAVTEPLRKTDETQHKVTITKPFFIGITPVTEKEFAVVTGRYPSLIPGDDLPVEYVTWAEAIDFCKRLSDKEGRFYRLPTEAEWEYACRAGTTTAYYTGNDKASLVDAAWYGGSGSNGNSSCTTHPVGQLRPNAWGLFDQLGNVHEFCADWYGKYPDGEQTDPTGPVTGSMVVARGGSFVDDLDDKSFNHRVANRISVGLFDYLTTLGFRVVLDMGKRPVSSDIVSASSQPTTTQVSADQHPGTATPVVPGLIADLAQDWSDLENPHNGWCFRAGPVTLPSVPHWRPLGSRFLQPAWAPSTLGGDFLPAWFKLADTFPDGDARRGDVIVHTTDLGNGAANGVADITWTSNFDGSVDIDGAVWNVLNRNRDNDYRLLLNGVLKSSGSLRSNEGHTRTTPLAFVIRNIPIVENDVVELQLIKATTHGDFVGVKLAIRRSGPDSPAEAEKRLREAVKHARAAVPSDPHNVAASLLDLANLLKQQNRLSEAEKAYREALDIRDGFLPADSDSVMNILDSLATILQGQSRAAEAQALYQKEFKAISAALPARPEDIPRHLQKVADLRMAIPMSLAHAGAFREAAEASEQAAEDEPGNAWYPSYSAAARLFLGDRAAYLRDCGLLRNRFAASKDPNVWLFIANSGLFDPMPGQDIKSLGKFAERLIENANTGLSAGARMDEGLAEYRAGHFETALKWLAATQRKQYGPQMNLVNQFLLAMAEYKVGNKAEARAVFAASIREFDTTITATPDVNRYISLNWFTLQITRREAESVILGKSPTTLSVSAATQPARTRPTSPAGDSQPTSR